MSKCSKDRINCRLYFGLSEICGKIMLSAIFGPKVKNLRPENILLNFGEKLKFQVPIIRYVGNLHLFVGILLEI